MFNARIFVACGSLAWPGLMNSIISSQNDTPLGGGIVSIDMMERYDKSNAVCARHMLRVSLTSDLGYMLF